MLNCMSLLMSTAFAGAIHWLVWWEVHLPMVNDVGLVFAKETTARIGTMKEGGAGVYRRSIEVHVSTMVFNLK